MKRFSAFGDKIRGMIPLVYEIIFLLTRLIRDVLMTLESLDLIVNSSLLFYDDILVLSSSLAPFVIVKSTAYVSATVGVSLLRGVVESSATRETVGVYSSQDCSSICDAETKASEKGVMRLEVFIFLISSFDCRFLTIFDLADF